MAFFVAEFVLVMQFLWKYIDEIIGKGFSLGVLLELIFYFSVRIIPEAVPISILIASVMVFGNLAEKYELSSMKTAGISLTRVMMGAILISLMTAMFSLFASNYLKPRANYKFLYRFNAIRKQKPALSIEEGVFNKDFRNIVVRVDKKGSNGVDIQDVLIFDHSAEDKRYVNILSASKGKMYAGGDDNDFIMELEDGEQYRELKNKKKKPSENYPLPFVRTKFKSWTKIFDMSEFDLEAENLNMTRKKYDLLNAGQLRLAIDSFDRAIVNNKQAMQYNFASLLNIEEIDTEETSESDALPQQVKEAIKSKDAIDNEQHVRQARPKPLRKQKMNASQEVRSIAELFEPQDAKSLLKTSKYVSERNNDNLLKATRHEDTLMYSRSLYVLRLNQQYSWALICIVFLFIGAPLGSIVKKGGYGYPLLIAIIFFMLFIIINIMGEKLNKSQSLDPLLAAWLPNLIIIPMAILFTYKALNDSDFSTIKTRIMMFFNKLMKKKS
jgi:lipopolysaccharide export system permease protein